MPPIAIELRGVTKVFPVRNAPRRTVLQDITLDVSEGTFLAVVGPSGCGKSTLLNLAAGLTAPSKGHVHIFDRPLSGLNRRAS